MDLFRWTLAFLGHLGLWCFIFNMIHSTALPRMFRKRTEKAIILAVAVPIVFFTAAMIWQKSTSFDTFCQIPLIKFFLYAWIVLGVLFFIQWLHRKLTFSLPSAVAEQKSECINLAAELPNDIFSPGIAKAIGKFPFNECLHLALNRLTLKLDLPKQLDGLKICQLSDLHLTGQIGIEFFHRIVAEANKFEPDLIFITGDLVDEAKCLPWLDSTLGELRAKQGVYYVLGNHDLRIKDETGFRKQLADLNLIQASKKWHEVSIEGAKILLTGTELPWYDDVNRIGAAPDCEPDLRICLSHSPDQLGWAESKNFDVMFAGHTHGGQIAFPVVGPIVAPSKYGVRYAAGTFQIGKMVMHVSRGLSGDEPIRFCCKPELGLFTLQSSRVFEVGSDEAKDQVEIARRSSQADEPLKPQNI